LNQRLRFLCSINPYFDLYDNYINLINITSREYFEDLILCDLLYNFCHINITNMTGNDSLFAQSRCGAFKIKPDDARLDEFLTKHKITISADDIAKLNSITDLKLRQYVKFSILYNLFLKKYYLTIGEPEFLSSDDTVLIHSHSHSNDMKSDENIYIAQEIYSINIESKPGLKVCVKFDTNGELKKDFFTKLDFKTDSHQVFILDSNIPEENTIIEKISAEGGIIKDCNMKGGVSKYKYYFMKYLFYTKNKTITAGEFPDTFLNKEYTIPLTMFPEEAEITEFGVYSKFVISCNYFCKAFDYQKQCPIASEEMCKQRGYIHYFFLGDLLTDNLIIDIPKGFSTFQFKLDRFLRLTTGKNTPYNHPKYYNGKPYYAAAAL